MQRHARPFRTPDLRVRYPFKLGKSLRRPSASRDLLALKFMHIPEKACVQSPATLIRNHDKCSIEMRTVDRNSSVQFEGTRRTYGSDSVVSDYVLVFANGVMSLEKAHDYFQNIRPVDTARTDKPKLEYPVLEEEDDPERDPDSWFAPDDGDASGSPITPEEDTVMEDRETNGVGGVSRTAGKSTSPPTIKAQQGRKMVSAGKVSGAKVDSGGVAVATTVAVKSVATKSVAGKGLMTGSRSTGSTRGDEKEEDDDDDDEAGSSSDDDDSDDSDSDSDSDGSGEYTDQSSDED